jgi:hypothetical protein
VSRTDGAFSLCPIPERRFFFYLMAHRTFSWNVCARTAEGWRLLGRRDSYTLVDSGPRFVERWACDLGSPSDCDVTEDLEVSLDKVREVLAPRECAGIDRR